MFEILINFVEHSKQRYDTAGDWQWTNEYETLTVTISHTESYKTNFLVAMHELIEAVLCRYNGIGQKEVDEFDLNYAGPYKEPGEDPLAPYFIQHLIATTIEKQLCSALRMKWEEHEQNLDSLPKWNTSNTSETSSPDKS